MAIRRELFAGEVLYRQGDVSDCAWLLESGTVELVSVTGRRVASHGVFGPGELIGELGQVISELRFTHDNDLKQTVNDLRSGIYFITGSHNGASFQKKLVVTR